MERYSNFFYKYLFVVVLIYYILHIIIKISSGGVEYDDAEQFLLYQNLSLYYTNAQPPLYNWLQYLFFKIFGLNIFAVAIFKHLILFLVFVLFYLLGRELKLSKIESLISTSLLFLLPQISWGVEFKLTHSVLLLMFSVLTYLLLLKYLKAPNLIHSTLLGVSIGLSILSKYSSILLILSITVAALLDNEYRRVVLSKKTLIVIVSSSVVVLPHIVPALYHYSEIVNAISQKTDKNLGIIHGLISLFKAFMAFLAPLFVFGATIFYKIGVIKGFRNRESKLIVTSIIVTFIIISIAIFVGVFDDFKERWFLPYLSITPLVIFAKIFPNKEYCYKKSASIVVSIVMVVILSIFFIRLIYPEIMYKIRGKYSHDAIDYNYLKEAIENRYKKPQNIITDTLMLGGNIKLIFPNANVAYFESIKRGSLVIKSKPFSGAKEFRVPYKFSRYNRYKSYYIKYIK